MQVRHVEGLLQPADRVELVLLTDAMKLDDELIDALQHAWGRVEQRRPLGAFHVHLHEHAVAAIAVARELMLEVVVEMSLGIGSRDGTDAFGMKSGQA
jgi:hypothetical protein